MATKQIRLKDGSIKVIQTCWGCPCVHKHFYDAIGEWTTCGLGTGLPSGTPSHLIQIPEGCLLEDFGTADLEIIAEKKK
jgi:hypothetical protein